MPDNIKIKNFGPIAHLDIDLGDLTILIGPQASGKTLFLQMLKLALDHEHIVSTLAKYNYVTENNVNNILNCYMGEGLSALWQDTTKVLFDKKELHKDMLATTTDETPQEKLFYIPAQRILSISDGRPKNFMEFDISSPYVLRQFSETLRLFFQKGIGNGHTLFPLNHHIQHDINESFNKTIFHDGKVVIDERTGQKKMRMEVGNISLPFMTWSAGQKEFMPLLMAFYSLADKGTSPSYRYVVIEEPEMGLHPSAIQTVLQQVIAMMSAGYKVIISTHSPVLLDFAWAKTPFKTKTYYFSRSEKNTVETIDISQFLSRASEVVAKI